jgi:hypothetical protein
MLALTRRFGSIDLRAQTKGPDLAFFTLSLVGLVAYPYGVMLALSYLGILAWLAFVVFAWIRRSFSPWRFLLSLAGLLAGILICVAAAQLAWGSIKGAHSAEVAIFGRFEGSATWQAGLMAGAGLLMIPLLVFLARSLGGFHLAAAACLLFLTFGFVFNSMTRFDDPLSTPWLAWQFLGGVAGMGTLLITHRPAWTVLLLSASALLVLAVDIPRLWMGTFTREDAWLTVLVTSIWVILFSPQVVAIFGKGTPPKRT